VHKAAGMKASIGDFAYGSSILLLLVINTTWTVRGAPVGIALAVLFLFILGYVGLLLRLNDR
jgi:hypothetical protein